MSSVSVWDRLNHTQAEASVARPQSEAKSEEERREWRRSFWRTTRVLDLLALLFWGYLVTKVFVADLDLAAVQALAPQYEWVVQVRVVWFLAILLVLAVVGRKKFPIWTGYILVWPLALLVWRLPWALWRRRAWKVAVWLIQMVLVPSSKPLITIGLSLVTVACTLLVLMGGKTLAAIGGTLSVATWLATLFLSARGVTKPSRFVMMQRWFLRKMSPKETDGEPKGRQVELMKVAQSRELTTAESEEFLRLAATDLGLINFLPFWATKFAETREVPSISLLDRCGL